MENLGRGDNPPKRKPPKKGKWRGPFAEPQGSSTEGNPLNRGGPEGYSTGKNPRKRGRDGLDEGERQTKRQAGGSGKRQSGPDLLMEEADRIIKGIKEDQRAKNARGRAENKEKQEAKREAIRGKRPAEEALESDDDALLPLRKKLETEKGKGLARDTSESDSSDSDAGSLKGTEESDIRIFQPEEPFRLRNFRVDSVRSIKSVARDLQSALESDAPPEHVYLQLFLLLREHPAIRKLEKRFKEIDGRDKEIDGRDLETALTEHFTKHFGEDSPQLQFALQLIKKGEVGTDRAIDEDLSEVGDGDRAKRLRNALESGKAEEVYAILVPFQRYTEWLCKFNEVYRRNNSDIGIQADIKRYLTGDSQKFARYLIGEGGLSWGDDSSSQEGVGPDQSRDPMELLDPPDHLRKIPYLETMVIPESVAERLAMAAAQLTYQPDSKKPDRNPVPYDVARDNCFYRAHLTSQAFKESGFASGFVYAQALVLEDGKKVKDLLLRTDLSHDGNSKGLYWGYHTACWIWVQTRSGKIERRIVDPAMDRNEPNRLWTVEEWMKNMGKDPGSYIFTTFEKWKKVAAEEREKYPEDAAFEDYMPAGQAYVFPTSRNIVDAIDISRVKKQANYKEDMPDRYIYQRRTGKMRKHLNEDAEQLPHYKIVQIIRNVMRNSIIKKNEDARRVFSDMAEEVERSRRKYHLPTPSGSTFRCGFSSDFPRNYKRFIKYLEEHGISEEIVTSFKESLADHNCRWAREMQKEMLQPTIKKDEAQDAKDLAAKKFKDEKINASVSEFHPSTPPKTSFKHDYPDIYDHFIAYLKERGVSPAMVTFFEDGLSGKLYPPEEGIS